MVQASLFASVFTTSFFIAFCLLGLVTAPPGDVVGIAEARNVYGAGCRGDAGGAQKRVCKSCGAPRLGLNVGAGGFKAANKRCRDGVDCRFTVIGTKPCSSD